MQKESNYNWRRVCRHLGCKTAGSKTIWGYSVWQDQSLSVSATILSGSHITDWTSQYIIPFPAYFQKQKACSDQIRWSQSDLAGPKQNKFRYRWILLWYPDYCNRLQDKFLRQSWDLQTFISSENNLWCYKDQKPYIKNFWKDHFFKRRWKRAVS